MTKASTQPLILSNPWDARARHAAVPTGGAARPNAAKEPRTAHATAVGDHMGTDALPPAMHERFARSLNATDLARAFAARVLDKHDRCMIFRHRLADQFPGASSVVHGFDLPEHHDYTKMIEFMDTGRWPRGTSSELVQLYPRLLRPLLDHADAAWKQAIHAQFTEAGIDATQLPSRTAASVEHSAEVVCDAIRMAHLEGARTLRLEGHVWLPSLPPHLTSLRPLQELTLEGMDSVSALPENLGHLKNLETLQLVNMTQLRALPESFAALHKLKSFAVLGHKLAHPFKLPEMLGAMPALRHIDVGTSRLPRPTWLPQSVHYEKAMLPPEHGTLP